MGQRDVHLVVDAKVFAGRGELEGGATPIVPLRWVDVVLAAPTTDELANPLPPGMSLFRLQPDMAIELALALYQAAMAQRES